MRGAVEEQTELYKHIAREHRSPKGLRFVFNRFLLDKSGDCNKADELGYKLLENVYCFESLFSPIKLNFALVSEGNNSVYNCVDSVVLRELYTFTWEDTCTALANNQVTLFSNFTTIELNTKVLWP